MPYDTNDLIQRLVQGSLARKGLDPETAARVVGRTKPRLEEIHNELFGAPYDPTFGGNLPGAQAGVPYTGPVQPDQPPLGPPEPAPNLPATPGIASTAPRGSALNNLSPDKWAGFIDENHRFAVREKPGLPSGEAIARANNIMREAGSRSKEAPLYREISDLKAAKAAGSPLMKSEAVRLAAFEASAPRRAEAAQAGKDREERLRNLNMIPKALLDRELGGGNSTALIRQIEDPKEQAMAIRKFGQEDRELNLKEKLANTQADEIRKQTEAIKASTGRGDADAAARIYETEAKRLDSLYRDGEISKDQYDAAIAAAKVEFRGGGSAPPIGPPTPAPDTGSPAPGPLSQAISAPPVSAAPQKPTLRQAVKQLGSESLKGTSGALGLADNAKASTIGKLLWDRIDSMDERTFQDVQKMVALKSQVDPEFLNESDGNFLGLGNDQHLHMSIVKNLLNMRDVDAKTALERLKQYKAKLHGKYGKPWSGIGGAIERFKKTGMP